MRKAKILLSCLCLVLLFNTAYAGNSRETHPAAAARSAKTNFPNIFRKIKKGFKKLFGIKSKEIREPVFFPVDKVILSQTEVAAACSKNGSCSNTQPLIEVVTKALVEEGKTITYTYQVSGGKIVGEGAKVIWDLSGVKAGTYTITVGVEDGCGICGPTKTETVKVVECAGCR